jgi:hypothetical protein
MAFWGYRFFGIHAASVARVHSCHMQKSDHSAQDLRGRWLKVEEVRLVSDLRMTHAKVDELYSAVQQLRHRHDEEDIVRFSDQVAPTEDIRRVGEIYPWYVQLKEKAVRE